MFLRSYLTLFVALCSLTFSVGARSPQFAEETLSIKKGIYQHYKGMLYEVTAIAHHSETLEEFVVYRMLYEDFGFWVRPAHMFTETVATAENEIVPRFKFLGEPGTLSE